MKKIITFLALLVGVTCSSSAALATPVGLVGPIQTYSSPFGSAHVATVETYLDGYFGVSDVTYLGRYDGASATFAPESILTGTGAFFTVTGGTTSSGTWTFGPGTSDYEIVAVEVSTSGDADLYAMSSAGNSGSWDTNDINGHKLSHLDFYARKITKVPEPISLGLMAAGLAGMSTLRKKKRT